MPGPDRVRDETGRTKRRPVPIRMLRRARRAARHRALSTAVGRRWLGRGGRQLVVCLGDSHARVFDRIQDSSLLPSTRLDVTWVLGATALGLANPNSRSHAIQEFRAALDGVPPDLPVVIMLGEIDCGFLLWWRADHQGTDVEKEFDQSLEIYTGFLDSLVDEGRTRLVLCSIPPPTIPDYTTWAGLDNARSQVRAGQRERTDLTLAYNARLRSWAADHGAAMLDYEPDVIDPATRLVDPAFVHPDPLNHHLHPQRFAEVVARRMADLGLGKATSGQPRPV